MKRREFMILLTAATVAARRLRAQQKPMPVIGALNIGSPPANLGDLLRGPIHQGMSEVGFVEGQNMIWEYRWAEYHYDRLPMLAAELVSRKVDVIVAGGAPSALAAKKATSTIPIVFAGIADPVGFGLVASLARPGGNLTGFSGLNIEVIPKQLELLCELVRQAALIAVLVNPDNEMNTELTIRTAQEAARAKGVQLAVLKASSESEIEAAFAQLHADALLVAADPFLFSRRDQLVALAARHAVPAIYPMTNTNTGFVAAGGLISYGTDLSDVFRQAGIYVGRILKGEKPADLPVPQPTIFKLSVNLKTAAALGLTVPLPILALADEVIE